MTIINLSAFKEQNLIYFEELKGPIFNMTLYPRRISGRWINGRSIINLQGLFITGPFSLYSGNCLELKPSNDEGKSMHIICYVFK